MAPLRAESPLGVISGWACRSAVRQVNLNKRSPIPRTRASLPSDPSSAGRMTTCWTCSVGAFRRAFKSGARRTTYRRACGLGRVIPCSDQAKQRHNIIGNRVALVGEESVSGVTVDGGKHAIKPPFPDCHARSPGRWLGLLTPSATDCPTLRSGLANQRMGNPRRHRWDPRPSTLGHPASRTDPIRAGIGSVPNGAEPLRHSIAGRDWLCR